MPEAEVQKHSDAICAHLQEFFSRKEHLNKHGVYGYYPLGNEVSLLKLYAWLSAHGIPLAFPRVSAKDMAFYEVSSMEEFAPGTFHVMEPLQSCRPAASEQAFCLVPGSVFDLSGNRCGYGAGYYDRYFLAHQNLYRIGIAYESQIEHKIPAGAHDIKMQAIATEHGIYDI